MTKTQFKGFIDAILREEGVTREQLEFDYVPMEKPFYKLSEREQLERVEYAKDRLKKLTKKAISKESLTAPSYEEYMKLLGENNNGLFPSDIVRRLLLSVMSEAIEQIAQESDDMKRWEEVLEYCQDLLKEQ